MPAINSKEGMGAETLQAMRDTALLFHDIVAPACQKRGLTLQQFYVLAELANKPRQTSTELADRVGILRTNFAAVCRKMEAKGLLMRERGADDKRKVYLSLADRGEALYDLVLNDVETTLRRGSIVMSEQDYLSIRDGAFSLRKLLEASLA